jgi:cell wall-associated NlpC family hydrolase
MTTLTYAQVAVVAKRAGFPEADLVTMVAVCSAESGRRVEALNSSSASGLWQILWKVHRQYDQRKLLSDPDYNARAAYDIFKSQGLRAWVAYSSGAYKKYLSAARQGVAQAASVNGNASVPQGNSSSAAAQPAVTYGPNGPEITGAGVGGPLRAEEEVSGPLSQFWIRGTQVQGDFANAIIGAPKFEAGFDTVPNLMFTIADPEGALLYTLDQQGWFWTSGGTVTYQDLIMKMDEIKFEPGSHSTGQLTVTAPDAIVYALMNLKGARAAAGISATEWIAQELSICGFDPNQVFLGESVPSQSMIARDEEDQSGNNTSGDEPSAWTTIVRLAKELGKRVFVSGSRLIFGSVAFAMQWANSGTMRLSYHGYTPAERFLSLPSGTRVSVGSKQGILQVQGRVPLNRAKYFRPGTRVSLIAIPSIVGATERIMIVSHISHDIGNDVDGADITLLEPIDPPPQPPQANSAGANGGDTSSGSSTSGGGNDSQIDKFVALALAQAGKRYVFGAEASPSDPNPRAFDCCLTADSMIYTANRGPVRMDEVEAGDLAWAMSDGGLSARKIEAVAQQRAQPIFAVRSRGRTLRASANHPVAVLCRAERERVGGRWLPVQWWIEWRRVDELKRGDLMVALERAPGFDEPVALPDGTAVTDDVAWLLGEFLGDGHCTSSGIAIAAFRPEVRARIARIVRENWGANSAEHPVHGIIVNSVKLRRVVHQVGLDRPARDKRVPHPLRRLAPAQLRAFLAGYAEADGHFDKRGHQSYDSCSRALIADVRALHIALGDRTSNVTTTQRTKEIVIKGKTVKNALPLHGFAVYPDTVSRAPRRNQTVLDTYGARRAIPDRAFTVERVLGVAADGEEATYDLQIEGARNYVAEGIVVHNSELVEWCAARVGISPKMPDGSSAQKAHCKAISAQQAINTKGALLFMPGHVAISLGNSKTIEAMSPSSGVRQGNANGRGWSGGGLIPGAQGYR